MPIEVCHRELALVPGEMARAIARRRMSVRSRADWASRLEKIAAQMRET
jgi:hypothetical protein